MFRMCRNSASLNARYSFRNNRTKMTSKNVESPRKPWRIIFSERIRNRVVETSHLRTCRWWYKSGFAVARLSPWPQYTRPGNDEWNETIPGQRLMLNRRSSRTYSGLYVIRRYGVRYGTSENVGKFTKLPVTLLQWRGALFAANVLRRDCRTPSIDGKRTYVPAVRLVRRSDNICIIRAASSWRIIYRRFFFFIPSNPFAPVIQYDFVRVYLFNTFRAVSGLDFDTFCTWITRRTTRDVAVIYVVVALVPPARGRRVRCAGETRTRPRQPCGTGALRCRGRCTAIVRRRIVISY